MNQTKTLILTGSAIMGIAYTPAPKPQPSADVVSKYITTHNSKWKYDPQKNYNDWNRSEQRKRELLSDIRSIRQQIRKQAEQMKSETDVDHGMCHKVITTICCNMMNAARNRESEILTERAREIRVPKQLLNKDKVLARKGVVSIEIM